MFDNTYDKRAFSEIIEILNHTDKQLVEKIPDNFIKFLFENMDKEYKVEIDFFDENWENTILEETKAILALIYRDYIVSIEERKDLLIEEKEEKEKQERELREKYDKSISISSDIPYPAVRKSKLEQIYDKAKGKIQGVFAKLKALVNPKDQVKENDTNERE